LVCSLVFYQAPCCGDCKKQHSSFFFFVYATHGGTKSPFVNPLLSFASSCSKGSDRWMIFFPFFLSLVAACVGELPTSRDFFSGFGPPKSRRIVGSNTTMRSFSFPPLVFIPLIKRLRKDLAFSLFGRPPFPCRPTDLQDWPQDPVIYSPFSFKLPLTVQRPSQVDRLERWVFFGVFFVLSSCYLDRFVRIFARQT